MKNFKYLAIIGLLFSLLPKSILGQDHINQKNTIGEAVGYWETKFPAKYGNPGYEEKGFYKAGKKEGTWYKLSLMGDTLGIENYRYGLKSGNCTYYTIAGLEHEEHWLAIDPTQEYDTVKVYDLNDEKYTLRRIKNEGKALQVGTWIYYQPEYGTILRTVRYDFGKIESDDYKSAKPSDPSYAQKPSYIAPKDKSKVKKPQAVLDWEKKNSGKKKIDIRTGATGL